MLDTRKKLVFLVNSTEGTLPKLMINRYAGTVMNLKETIEKQKLEHTIKWSIQLFGDDFYYKAAYLLLYETW
jgi:hypothetical protein